MATVASEKLIPPRTGDPWLKPTFTGDLMVALIKILQA